MGAPGRAVRRRGAGAPGQPARPGDHAAPGAGHDGRGPAPVAPGPERGAGHARRRGAVPRARVAPARRRRRPRRRAGLLVLLAGGTPQAAARLPARADLLGDAARSPTPTATCARAATGAPSWRRPTCSCATPSAPRDALLLEGADPSRIVVAPPGIDVERFAVAARARRAGRPPRAVRRAPGLGEGPPGRRCGRSRSLRGPRPGRGPASARRRDRARGARGCGASRATWGSRTASSSAARCRTTSCPRSTRAASALVLASLRTPYWEEQFGMVLPEAMASHLPLVVSTSGAIPEVVGPQAATFAPGRLGRARRTAGRGRARGPRRARPRPPGAVLGARRRRAPAGPPTSACACRDGRRRRRDLQRPGARRRLPGVPASPDCAVHGDRGRQRLVRRDGAGRRRALPRGEAGAPRRQRGLRGRGGGGRRRGRRRRDRARQRRRRGPAGLRGGDGARARGRPARGDGRGPARRSPGRSSSTGSGSSSTSP